MKSKGFGHHKKEKPFKHVGLGGPMVYIKEFPKKILPWVMATQLFFIFTPTWGKISMLINILQMSNEKRAPGCSFRYIGDYTIQLYRD